MKKSLAIVLTLVLVFGITGLAYAQPPGNGGGSQNGKGQPNFEASIDITSETGAFEVEEGQTLELTADWETNRDVTREAWSVADAEEETVTMDGTGEVVIVDASEGESTFVFDADGLAPGEYRVCFELWHHADPPGGGDPVNRYAKQCVIITVIPEQSECECEWKSETAWAAGERYANQGNWATYTAYAAGETVTLYAGQAMEAGTVHFSAAVDSEVTITITLGEGWRFKDVAENVKIQDYQSAPSGNPNPGGFQWKGSADSEQSVFTIDVPENAFYGIHVDVEWLNCDCD